MMCPRLTQGLLSDPNTEDLVEAAVHPAGRCVERKCAWWTVAYTTEGIQVSDCAVVIAARTDSDGRVVV